MFLCYFLGLVKKVNIFKIFYTLYLSLLNLKNNIKTGLYMCLCVHGVGRGLVSVIELS